MKVWIDICHTPQYNFYRELILRLVSGSGSAPGSGSAEGEHEVLITVLRRGKTPVIVRKELAAALAALPAEARERVHIYEVGRHRMTKWSAILEANILRLVALLWWRLWHRVDIAFGNGMQPAIIQALFRGRSYSFDDDPQTRDFGPKAKWNTECNFCLYDDPQTAAHGGKVHVLKCLKEWAYLAPSVFRPKVSALGAYNLRPKEYIFVREVSVGTVNYANQSPQAILQVADLIEHARDFYTPVPGTEPDFCVNLHNSTPLVSDPKTSNLCKMQVLFSLEEKHRRNEYPADWILLQEPIEDIHSLIYYSAGLVSSGDSMAREAALLGIPSYYLGTRHSMPANLAAAKVAGLQNELTMPFEEWLGTLKGTPEELMARQEALRAKINQDFIDINAYMIGLVEKAKGERLKAKG